LIQWLADGMSMASASAFMITGPATKITNLGALKFVLGGWKFAAYLAFVIIYSLINGFIVELLT
ncbi:MAG: permease, partial [Synergistaceae bacterium]|nr:permease [Synergistaceae bacterium]